MNPLLQRLHPYLFERLRNNGLGLAVLPCFMGDSQASLKRVTGTLEDCKNELWKLMHLDLRDTVRVKTVYQVMLEELGQASSLFAGAAA